MHLDDAAAMAYPGVFVGLRARSLPINSGACVQLDDLIAETATWDQATDAGALMAPVLVALETRRTNDIVDVLASLAAVPDADWLFARLAWKIGLAIESAIVGDFLPQGPEGDVEWFKRDANIAWSGCEDLDWRERDTYIAQHLANASNIFQHESVLTVAMDKSRVARKDTTLVMLATPDDYGQWAAPVVAPT